MVGVWFLDFEAASRGDDVDDEVDGALEGAEVLMVSVLSWVGSAVLSPFVGESVWE